MTSDGTDDRIAGALVGLAAGDALGAGYEFGPPPAEIVPMKGGGPFGWEPGEWTDDTQMAICIAEEAATGSLDPVAVGDRFLGWVREASDVGVQTRAVLDGAVVRRRPARSGGRALRPEPERGGRERVVDAHRSGRPRPPG